MARTLPDWLSYYLEYTKNTEPPTSYHYWTGVSLIASALGRKVRTVWGSQTIYPNQYIMLVGPSAASRKGVAMDLGWEILEPLGLPISADALSKERLLQVMAESGSSWNDGTTGEVMWQNELTTYSKEFAVFLRQGNIDLLALLTDLYDCPGSWKYETKNSGKDTLTDLCYNILAATAPDWFSAILPQEALGGGFTSRIIFVMEEFRRQTVADEKLTDEGLRLKRFLIDDLHEIGNISGEYVFSKEAKAAYVSWYEQASEDAKRGLYPIEDPLFISYCERRQTHVRKLCLAIAASRRSKLVVELEDFESARVALEKIEKNMHKVFGGQGRSPNSEMIYSILKFIKDKKRVTRSELLNSFYRDLGSTNVLTEIEIMLKAMGVVAIEMEEGGRQTYVYCGKD